MRTGALWLSLWIGPRLRLIAIFVGSFPASFEFLDLIYGVRDGTDDKYHWRLVRRSYNKAILYGKSLVDGHDLLSEANPNSPDPDSLDDATGAKEGNEPSDGDVTLSDDGLFPTGHQNASWDVSFLDSVSSPSGTPGPEAAANASAPLSPTGTAAPGADESADPPPSTQRRKGLRTPGPPRYKNGGGISLLDV
ncbi:hypothetical protein C8Q76DRAFT_790753 [Earliella scabrosa]|nr:hypothetical protein C8Q76DRAFT_790753 [Earliella scabrosa]